MRKNPRWLTLTLSMSLTVSLTLALLLTPSLAASQAIAMSRDEFLRTHLWDAQAEAWLLRPGVALPPGVADRGKLLEAREHFLSHHRWVESVGWRSFAVAPRNLDAMPQAERRSETRRFLRTHVWDEQAGRWVIRPTALADRPPAGQVSVR
jgi:hypothetical protein